MDRYIVPYLHFLDTNIVPNQRTLSVASGYRSRFIPTPAPVVGIKFQLGTIFVSQVGQYICPIGQYLCLLTYIHTNDERGIPNPNVMIELGYALAHLSEKNVILVLNTALGEIAKAPFDIRNRRIMTYHLAPEGADETPDGPIKQQQRDTLTLKLKRAFQTILETTERSQQQAVTIPSFPTSFMREIGIDPNEGEWFGCNQWNKQLGGFFIEGDDILNATIHVHTALSWMTVTVQPVHPINLPIHKIFETYGKGKIISDPDPSAQFILPWNTQTTSNSLIYYDEFSPRSLESPLLQERYLRVNDQGHIEYAESSSFIFRRMKIGTQEQRIFRFVPLIGIFGQVLSLTRRIYDLADYSGAYIVSLNLIGTRDTQLDTFATIPNDRGESWREPLSQEARNIHMGNTQGLLVCTEPFLHFPLVIDEPKQGVIQTMYDLARKVGYAYNHQSEPRCFIRGTHDFPWRLFQEIVRAIR